MVIKKPQLITRQSDKGSPCSKYMITSNSSYLRYRRHKPTIVQSQKIVVRSTNVKNFNVFVEVGGFEPPSY